MWPKAEIGNGAGSRNRNKAVLLTTMKVARTAISRVTKNFQAVGGNIERGLAMSYRNVRTHMSRASCYSDWGLSIRYSNGQNTIVQIAPDSPADYAALCVGDIIVSANGIDCRRADLKEVIRNMGTNHMDITVQRKRNNHEYMSHIRGNYDAYPYAFDYTYSDYGDSDVTPSIRSDASPVIIDLVSDDDTPPIASRPTSSNRNIITTSDDEIQFLPAKRAVSSETPAKRAKPSPEVVLIKREPVGFGEADSDEVTEIRNPHPPPTPVAVAVTSVDDDDVEFVGGTVSTISDMPHPREHCTIHKFHPIITPSNLSICNNCYCYVCDIRASECKSWDSHCNATFRLPQWKQMRQALTSEISIVPPERRGNFYEREYKELRNMLSTMSYYGGDRSCLGIIAKYLTLVKECMFTTGEHFPEALVICCKIIMYYANSYHHNISSSLRTEIYRLLAHVSVSQFYTTQQKNFVNSKLPSLAQTVSSFKRFLALGQYMKDWNTYKNNFNASEKAIIVNVLIYAKYDTTLIEPILPKSYLEELETSMLTSEMYDLAWKYVNQCISDAPLEIVLIPELSPLQNMLHVIMVAQKCPHYGTRAVAVNLIRETVTAFPTTDSLIDEFRRLIELIKTETNHSVFTSENKVNAFEVFQYLAKRLNDTPLVTAQCLAMMTLGNSFVLGCLSILNSAKIETTCSFFSHYVGDVTDFKGFPTCTRSVPDVVLQRWSSFDDMNLMFLVDPKRKKHESCICSYPLILFNAFYDMVTPESKASSLRLHYLVAVKYFFSGMDRGYVQNAMKTFQKIIEVAIANNFALSPFLKFSQSLKVDYVSFSSFEDACRILSRVHAFFQKPQTSCDARLDYSVLSFPMVDELGWSFWRVVLYNIYKAFARDDHTMVVYPIPYVTLDWTDFNDEQELSVIRLLEGLCKLKNVSTSEEDVINDAVWLHSDSVNELKRRLPIWAARFGTKIATEYMAFVVSPAGECILKFDDTFFDSSLMTYLTAKTVVNMYCKEIEQLQRIVTKIAEHVNKLLDANEDLSGTALVDCVVLALCTENEELVQRTISSLLKFDDSIYASIDYIYGAFLSQRSDPGTRWNRFREPAPVAPDGLLQLIPYVLYSIAHCEDSDLVAHLKQHASILRNSWLCCMRRATRKEEALLSFCSYINKENFDIIVNADMSRHFPNSAILKEILLSYVSKAYPAQEVCLLKPAEYLEICNQHMTLKDVLNLIRLHTGSEYRIHRNSEYHEFLERLLKMLPMYSLHDKLDVLGVMLQMTLYYVGLSHEYYWKSRERELLGKALETVSLVNNDTLVLHLIACPSVERYETLVEQNVIPDKCAVLASLHGDNLSVFIELVIKEELYHLLLQPVMLGRDQVEPCLCALVSYFQSKSCDTTLGLFTGPASWSMNDRCMNAFNNRGFLHLITEWLIMQRHCPSICHHPAQHEKTLELIDTLLDELLRLCDNCAFVACLKQIILTLAGDAVMELSLLTRKFDNDHPNVLSRNLSEDITNSVMMMIMKHTYCETILRLRLAIQLLTSTHDPVMFSAEIMHVIAKPIQATVNSREFAQALLKWSVKEHIGDTNSIPEDVLRCSNEAVVSRLNEAIFELFASKRNCIILRTWEPIVKRGACNLALFECFCNGTTSLKLMRDAMRCANENKVGEELLSILFPKLYDVTDFTLQILPAFLLSPEFFQLGSEKWMTEFYEKIRDSNRLYHSTSEYLRILLTNAFFENGYDIGQSYMRTDTLMKLMAGVVRGHYPDLLEYDSACPRAFEIIQKFIEMRNKPFIDYLLNAIRNVISHLSTNRVSKVDRAKFQALGKRIRPLFLAHHDLCQHWLTLLSYLKMHVGSKRYLIQLFQSDE